MLGRRRPAGSHWTGHVWSVFLPVYLFAVTMLDPHEVTNREYLQFILATGHRAPEYWVGGRTPADGENEPVVLVSWHDAVSYCRFVKRRLPTVDEWTSACKAGTLEKRGDIWEWTSTDVDMDGQTFKALCGPAGSCDCSHRYLAEWKNEVKGFRCVGESPPLTWLQLFFGQGTFS